ncbi:MAG: SAM-dependent methyltransferase [Myxococcota bacterium]
MNPDAVQKVRYEDVPYPNLVQRWSHPRVVGAMAALWGIDAAPVEHCRVLDIGCGTATNVIAMAYDLPESKFVGVDVAPAQIASGQAQATALGLDNVRLIAGSVADLGDDLGLFDYIICHGVYTWVAPPVRELVLANARRLLAPHGVFYMSYNCYPGWHFGDLVKTLFLRRTDPNAAPLDRVQQARQILHSISSAAEVGTLTSAAMMMEKAFIENMSDSYIYHEYFEPDQSAIFFEDAVRQTQDHDLRYLANARPERQLPSTQPPTIRAALETTPSRELQQQLVDHFVGTRFRRTLFCRGDGPEPMLAMDPEVLDRLHARIPRGHALDETDETTLGLVLDGERTVTVNRGTVAEVLTRLSEASPVSIALSTVLAGVGDARRQVAAELLGLFFAGALELSLGPISAARTLAEHPTASPLARIQATLDPMVTSRLHVSEHLDALSRQVIQLLDGSRTVADIMAETGTTQAQIDHMVGEFLVKNLLI